MALAYWYLVVLTKFEWEVWFITFGCGVKAVVKNAIAIQRSENFHPRANVWFKRDILKY